MLVLTRRVGESVKIGHHVTVTVLSIKGDQVKLGTLAPQDLPVHREEIYERVNANNKAYGPPRHRSSPGRRVRER